MRRVCAPLIVCFLVALAGCGSDTSASGRSGHATGDVDAGDAPADVAVDVAPDAADTRPPSTYGLPDGSQTSTDGQHVIFIDIDDHGLKGLWNADAPNLKGLIARGTFGYTRVIIPTHSNQSNMALLTAQYPDGNNVPHNSWLNRANGFKQAVSVGSLGMGDYGLWDKNPLRTRSQSLYTLAKEQGDHPIYVGPMPPFEVGADEVHLTITGKQIVGLNIGIGGITPAVGRTLLKTVFHYPSDVANSYKFDSSSDSNETVTHFTLRDAADVIRHTDANHPLPKFMFIWDFIAIDGNPTNEYGADGEHLQQIIADYDDGVGELLSALQASGHLQDTNIVFTLDHGKVDTHNQVNLGTRGGGLIRKGNGQLGDLVDARSDELGITTRDYAILNEDGDAQIYAKVDHAGTPEGAQRQKEVTHALLKVIQSGDIVGLDTTRTLTADGAMGTRRFHDYRDDSPNQPDIVVFPKPDWTLNKVDKFNGDPGPFKEHTDYPFGRHGGFSEDELYVPLIMAGPAFKEGKLLAHPVNHPDVAATVAYVLAHKNLQGAEGSPILSAIKGYPGDLVDQPSDMTTTRDTVLHNSGFHGAVNLVAAPAKSAVIIDVAGLYYDEVFADPDIPDAAASPLRRLAQKGTLFENCKLRYRDWPVNEYEGLTGGYPVQDPWIPFATDDPAMDVFPGYGLLKILPVDNFVADHSGYAVWHGDEDFGTPSVFDAAKHMGLSTALFGAVDFQDHHIDAGAIDDQEAVDADQLAGKVGDYIAHHDRALVVVSLGGERAGDRHSATAEQQLATLSKRVADIARAAGPDTLVVVTSRGATPIDDAQADFYGPGSSQHVPLILVGPNVRQGVITGQPAQSSDLPATVLVGLGAASRTDFADGTWAAGDPIHGVPHPTPSGATGGHALLSAFELSP